MGSMFSSAAVGIKCPTEFGLAAKRTAWFASNLRTTSERTSLRRETEPTNDVGIEGQFNITAV
jgi:hypothetical protein